MKDDEVSDDEKKLFRHMMQGVKPLKRTGKISISEPKVIKRVIVKEERRLTSTPMVGTPYLSDYYAHAVQSDSVLSYNPNRIATQYKLLRSGKIPWQARLDLHGLKTDLARETLARFIQEQYADSCRCLLIIHGKGGRHGEEPILKNLVNHWLRQFPQVLAFHSAVPKDGGTGALYVLLKRIRS
jgi:DNA-nicking Smr family endonuclease